ncbi:MAG: NUDIX hydrolase [Candidatus Izimaplasma sp.]|nr:NUDIX hydrolase [Candidatus Izimaplasma bacterium]
MKLIEKTINSVKKYTCFFMELFEDDVLLPNNKQTKRIYIKHGGAAAVLPITKTGDIILVEQYRYPIKQVSLEIPAGKKDTKEEQGIDCVKRELEEETGYQSSAFSFLLKTHTCVGYSNELIELYMAEDCYEVQTPIQADDDEFINVRKFTKEEVKTLLKDNSITDSKTIIALQYYLNQKKWIKWDI